MTDRRRSAMLDRGRRRRLSLLVGAGLGVVGLVVVSAGGLQDAGWDAELPSLGDGGGPLEVAALLGTMVGVVLIVWASVRLWRRRPFPSLVVHGVDPARLRRAKVAVRRGEVPQGSDRALVLHVADRVARQSEPLLFLGLAFLQVSSALTGDGAMRWVYVALAVSLLAMALLIAVQRRRAQGVLRHA